jgi:hypothetical protein
MLPRGANQDSRSSKFHDGVNAGMAQSWRMDAKRKDAANKCAEFLLSMLSRLGRMSSVKSLVHCISI